MSSGSYTTDNDVHKYHAALKRVNDAIDSIIILRNGNLDKPEIWGVADTALDQLTKIERDLTNALNEHQQLLDDSSLKRLARGILEKLTSSKKKSGLSTEEAKRQEQKIVAKFNLESDRIIRTYQASSNQHQSSVPTSYWTPGSSAPMTHNARSKAYVDRGNHNNQPSSANRIQVYQGSPFTSREHRGHVYTSPAQQNYYNSQTRVQGFYDQDQSTTNDPPPPYYSVRSSQRHQSGSLNSSQRDQNSSYGSVHSDEVTRGSHRSIRSGVSYDPRNAEASTSQGARVSSAGSGFSDEDYSNEATHGSMDEYQGARQVRRGEYPPGTAASGSSSQSNYYYSSGYPVRDESQ